MIKVALVDDHKLFRRGIASLINSFSEYKIVLEAGSGEELISVLNHTNLPDLLLLDIKMPGIDGFATLAYLTKKFPEVKVLALSMYDDEKSVIRMIGLGARGYLLKDSEPIELKNALDSVYDKGYFYSEFVTGNLIHSLHHKKPDEKPGEHPISLNDREIDFLKLVCKELTYKEIADIMCLSTRTIDGYRDALFQKLSVKNRVGLVLYTLKVGLVSI